MSQSKNVINTTDQDFDTAVQGNSVSLVDFWAEWCGPCRLLGPTIDQIADEYQGKIKVYKMNVDENPMTPSRYNIRGIPTVLVFKNGQLVDQMVGNQPKDAITQVIQKHI
jgi:thioredoxin 1